MKMTTVGMDLAQNVFQVHGVNAHGKTVMRKQLKRHQGPRSSPTCRRV